MENIETARLIIRNFREDDVDGLRETILAYKASEYAVYDYPWPSSLEEIQGVVRWFSGGDRFFAVCLKETGQFMGFISLSPSEEPGGAAFDLGYVFHSCYHGHGFATEGCRALIEYAFQTLGAKQITSGTAAVNHPSCSLLARLGFQLAGQGRTTFQKDAQGNPIEFDGCLFALTREAWEKAAAVAD